MHHPALQLGHMTFYITIAVTASIATIAVVAIIIAITVTAITATTIVTTTTIKMPCSNACSPWDSKFALLEVSKAHEC
jgi:hypothetical protein